MTTLLLQALTLLLLWLTAPLDAWGMAGWGAKWQAVCALFRLPSSQASPPPPRPPCRPHWPSSRGSSTALCCGRSTAGAASWRCACGGTWPTGTPQSRESTRVQGFEVSRVVLYIRLLGVGGRWCGPPYFCAPLRRTRRKCFASWAALTIHKLSASERADALFVRITRDFAATTLTAVLSEWRRTARQRVGLRHILQRVLGRFLELGYGGWRCEEGGRARGWQEWEGEQR